MKSKYRNPLVALVLLVLLLLAGYFNRDRLFGDKDNPKDPDNRPDTTQIDLPIQERFVWRNYITSDERVLLPVLPSRISPVRNIKAKVECVFLEGRLQPVIHLSFEASTQAPVMRMDAALTYRGFEENKFTTLFPFQQTQRFKLPTTSQFMADTTALNILGSAQFPRLENYRVEQIANPSASLYRHNLQISKLDGGLSYRFRLADLGQQSQAWRSTEDLVLTTPACPNDEAR